MTKASQEPSEPVAIDRSKGQWFILQTATGLENKVREKLESEMRIAAGKIPVYEVLIPASKFLDPKTGRTVSRKLFPNYIYVRMDLYHEDGSLNEDVWYFVRSVQGITRFVGNPERPVPLENSEVEELLRVVDNTEEGGAQAPPPPSWLLVGSVVRVEDRDCVFNGFEGKIIEIDPAHAKLKLMVSIFERDTPVELEFRQVGPCED